MPALLVTDRARCGWVGSDPDYVAYHDDEWCVPVHDDRKQFEMLVLEFMQAGLSWLAIIKKRENFRVAFDGWDVARIARYGVREKKRLMNDAGIIRNRRKIDAAVRNAQAFLRVQNEFGSFDRYIWQFTGGVTLTRKRRLKNWRRMPATSKESEAMSRDLKKRDFAFVGPTVCYSYMQGIGMVDDHVEGCFKAR